MNTKLMAPPWGVPKMTAEAEEAIRILGDNVWAEAAVEFFAERQAKKNNGKIAPKGMQKTINAILERKFGEAGWVGEAGYFVKNETWVRVTFRHQMSLGSDLIDALKVCKKEGIRLAMICAADRKTLGVISPQDASAMISFEKLKTTVMDLDGAVDIPLVIGCLTQKTHASQPIEDGLREKRERDRTLPGY